MSLKSFISLYYARLVASNIKKWSDNPIETQEKVLQDLIQSAKNTAFGKDHYFSEIKSYEDFKKNVPVRDYEAFTPYINRIINGESDVLWKGVPIYFCKTSGTTSGTKCIPISKESISNHIDSARNALLSYIAETGNNSFVDGKMIFLQGSPVLEKKGNIPTGRLSGIVAHHVPAYLQKNRMPSFVTNCIDDWEEKVSAISYETIKEDMRLISGIPPWVQMYFEKLLDISGKKNIKELFPNFSLFVYGGVNYEPYRNRMEQLIGAKVDSIETYPASEGFIAFQNSQKEEGLLLILNKGIFYEFIPAEEYFNENPTRISLKDVELGKNYALIMNTNAGLWGYSIGDTVKFVSKNPYKIIVTGRIKHFTSAFGEHVIAEEVEFAMKKALEKHGGEVIDFHVAPQVNPIEGGLPYHEWFIEFAQQPSDLNAFAKELDTLMQQKNIYYRDLISGNILKPLVISVLKKDAFIQYMKSQGKLGGQNKTPRLANDRKMADALSLFKQ
jgi:hypothetical protein